MIPSVRGEMKHAGAVMCAFRKGAALKLGGVRANAWCCVPATPRAMALLGMVGVGRVHGDVEHHLAARVPFGQVVERLHGVAHHRQADRQTGRETACGYIR